MCPCKCLPPESSGRGGKVGREIVSKLDRGYARLKSAKTPSLLKTYLTPQAYDVLKRRKTSYGSTFLDVVQSGMANTDSKIGLYAPDPEAYTVYRPLFNAILDDYHGDFTKENKQPLPSWGNPVKLFNHDPEEKYIVATRVRVCRNLADYPFAPCLTRGLYKQIEDTVVPVLEKLEGEFKGTYIPLEKMTPEMEKEMIKDHYLFQRCNKYLLSANAGRFWPTGRGIYINRKSNFMVWLGKEDHVRVISMDKGPKLKETYERLYRAMRILDAELYFAHDHRLGYLTMCPSNLGTTLRASVHVRFPDLTEEEVRKLAEENNLEVRGTTGEFTPVEDGLYDISNKKRLGLTEFEAVRHLHEGLGKLIWQQERKEIMMKNDLKNQLLDEAFDKWMKEQAKGDEMKGEDKNQSGEKEEQGTAHPEEHPKENAGDKTEEQEETGGQEQEQKEEKNEEQEEENQEEGKQEEENQEDKQVEEEAKQEGEEEQPVGENEEGQEATGEAGAPVEAA